MRAIIKSALITLTLINTCLGLIAQQLPFSKSISIDETIQIKTFKDSADLKIISAFAQKVTNKMANLLTAYQQEYDYKFYRNYAKNRKVQTEIQFSGRIIDRAEKNFKDDYWFYNTHLKGDYFLAFIRNDTTRAYGWSFIDMPFTLEEMQSEKALEKVEKQMVDWLRVEIIYSFYITSQRLNPKNQFKDTVSFSINEIFECKSEDESFKADPNYLRKLTDLVNNALIWQQTKPPHEKSFHQYKYYQNYLKAEKKQKQCENVVYCRLTYDHHRKEYSMDIDIMINGELMPIPEDFDHRLIFDEKNMNSYSKVGEYILGRVGTLLWIYKENFIYD